MITEIIIFLMQITIILIFLSVIHRTCRYLFFQIKFHKELMEEMFTVHKIKSQLVLERYKTENSIRKEAILRLTKGEF